MMKNIRKKQSQEKNGKSKRIIFQRKDLYENDQNQGQTT